MLQSVLYMLLFGLSRGVMQGRAAAQACRAGFSCCVLAAPEVQPLLLLRAVLPLLAPSACFAVFHNCVQPLAEAMHQLQVLALTAVLHSPACSSLICSLARNMDNWKCPLDK